SLGFSSSASARGQDVAGSFVVNGVTEAAVGNGQILAATAGNAKTNGLQVRVSLTADQVAQGATGTVNVTRGVASRLGQVLNSFLDPVSGRLKTIDQSFQD